MILDTVDKKIIKILEKGPLHPSQIARDILIPRTTINYRLERLKKIKLINSKTDGKKQIWSINHQIQKTNEDIEIYSGDNFKKAYNYCLKIKPNSIIFSIQCAGAAKHEIQNLPRELVFKVHDYFKKNDIVFKSISHIKILETINKLDKQYLQSHTGRAGSLKMFKDETFLNNGEIMSCNQFVIIANTKDKKAIVIKNKDIVEMYYQTLSLVIESLEHIRGFNLNEYFKKITER